MWSLTLPVCKNSLVPSLLVENLACSLRTTSHVQLICSCLFQLVFKIHEVFLSFFLP